MVGHNRPPEFLRDEVTRTVKELNGLLEETQKLGVRVSVKDNRVKIRQLRWK